MLAALRSALKPEGRLVIVEPISDAKRSSSRTEQTRGHEIAPEFVQADARSAGFRIVHMQDPFTSRGRDLEWLLALQPADTAPATAPAVVAGQPSAVPSTESTDPTLRITQEDFVKLTAARAVTIVDVRDAEAFRGAHIPGAISIPLDSIDQAIIERLRKAGKPVVTYCS